MRDDLHMKVHQCWKECLLTPTVKDIQWTRADGLLQWHTENGHKSILFIDKKIFTIEGSTAARTTRLMLERPVR
jgi:hypothetical protein